MSTHPAHASLERLLTIKGAISSVALSHPERCACRVCRASRGDTDALVDLYDEIEASRTPTQESEPSDG